MLHKVDFSKPMWRYLYQPLYARVLKVANAKAELEANVQVYFSRLILMEPGLYYLVEFDTDSFTNIKSHCLVSLIPVNKTELHALIPQYEIHTTSNFLAECIDYIKNTIILSYPNITKIVYNASSQEYRSLRKKHGFNLDFNVLSLDIKPVESIVGLEVN